MTASKAKAKVISLDSPEAFFNRELSWLNFARRVLALVEDPHLPLLERVKFAGIMGMLHDEFFMKRASGLMRQIKKGTSKLSLDGRTPQEELADGRAQIIEQMKVLAQVIHKEILPGLAAAGIPILDYEDLSKDQRDEVRDYFVRSVLPILTPLAVDAEHPFPFISNHGLNLAVQLRDSDKRKKRFVRIKVPDNRQRWVPLLNHSGFIPLEQVIANNLDLVFPEAEGFETYYFRVTRGAEGEQPEMRDLEDTETITPGSILRQVTGSLKARRFAGVVRVKVDPRMPDSLIEWLTQQLEVTSTEVFRTSYFLGINDLLKFRPPGHPELCDPVHTPVDHPRLAHLEEGTTAIFDEIRKGDILLHLPYHNFDSSVLRFIQSAARDPKTLALKITIYRTSSDSPIIQALVEAARNGKQVAVIVEITARFDEAPNIAWGKLLEEEGVHVAYGVEQLKTHVKLALAVREEKDGIRRYAHVGTGNYHSGTARIYEDLGLLTCDPAICADAAAVFNELTGAVASHAYKELLVAPHTMQARFTDMIRREAEHAKAGRCSGIYAKMNQLEEPSIIRELYLASQAGVPITINVRGLCCLRPGIPSLSENIRVYGLVGRFLEHSRLYRFENGGQREYYTGSADWMRRNLSRRIETIAPVKNPQIQRELDDVIEVYETDNSSVWDCQPDGSYSRRKPAEGEPARAAQLEFIEQAHARQVHFADDHSARD
jgi:polyphosphate kinase